MRAKATKARAAQSMQKRAERLLAGVSADRAAERVAKLRFPVPQKSSYKDGSGHLISNIKNIHRVH